MVEKRRKFSSEFKAKVALESVRGAKTLTELSQEYKVHPNASEERGIIIITNALAV